MLARILEKLLDPRPFSPQTHAIVGVLVIGAGLSIALLLQRDPPHAEEVVAAKKLVFSGSIRRQTFGERKSRLLWVAKAHALVILPGTSSYYQVTAYEQLLRKTTGNFFLYDAARPFSLMEQAQVGDSVVKQRGRLTVYLFRDGRMQTFVYKCPYHSYEFDY